MTDATSTTDRPGSSARRAYGEAGEHTTAIDDLLTGKLDPSGPLALGPDACPAYRIGAQIGRLVAQHSELDQAGVHPNKEQEGDRDRMMGRASAAIELLQDAATYVRATSAGGALAQLVVGTQLVLRGFESSQDDDDREDLLRAALRCFYAVAPLLEAASGVPARCFGSDYLMPDHLDAVVRAYEPVRATNWSSEPKPTVDDVRDRVFASVEHRLIEHNCIAAEWWAIYQDSGRKEDEADQADPPDRAKKAMAEQTASHAIRISRENLIHAMALPAVTPRELGLQARLVSLELREWWDDNKQPDGELACRVLLDRLMACAGVATIPDTRDVTPAEARDWLANPRDHAHRYNPDLRASAK